MVTRSVRGCRRAVEADGVVQVQIEHRKVHACAEAGDGLVDGEVVCLGFEPERGLTFSLNDDLRVEMIYVAAVDEPLEVGVLVRDVSCKERELEGVYLSLDSA